MLFLCFFWFLMPDMYRMKPSGFSDYITGVLKQTSSDAFVFKRQFILNCQNIMLGFSVHKAGSRSFATKSSSATCSPSDSVKGHIWM